MTIALTGHRPDKLGGEYDYVGPYTTSVRDTLQLLIEKHKPKLMITGMAQGADTIWAILAIKNKIDFIAAIPFEGQEKKWPEKAQKLYRTIIYNTLCRRVVVSEGGYDSKKMQIRNIWMVDNCDALIAVWDGSPGGTKNCVDYAKSQRRIILPVRPLI
jgi:uncharacterized phage-like protein YoqJ